MDYQWDIIGHHRQVQYLQNSIKNGKINHAYLFYGPEHLGKKKIAQSFLYSLLCLSETKSKPCYRCLNCKQLKKGIYSDVHLLKPEPEKKNISVKQVRDLMTKLHQTSLSQGYKIALIEQASDLTIGAANALLKTLEEPAPKTIIILLVKDLSTLPKTVISRCQMIRFLPVNREDIYSYLKSKTNRDETLKITNLAHGKPGLAINFLEKKKALSKYEEKMKLVNILLSQNIKEKFKLAEKIHRSKKSAEELSILLDLGIIYLRDEILNQHNLKKYATNSIKNNESNIRKTIQQIKKLEKSKELLSKNIQPKLILENLIINS